MKYLRLLLALASMSALVASVARAEGDKKASKECCKEGKSCCEKEKSCCDKEKSGDKKAEKKS